MITKMSRQFLCHYNNIGNATTSQQTGDYIFAGPGVVLWYALHIINGRRVYYLSYYFIEMYAAVTPSTTLRTARTIRHQSPSYGRRLAPVKGLLAPVKVLRWYLWRI